MPWPRRSKTTLQNGESAFPQGLDEFCSPDHASVDIVLVHGLTGDRERTWTHPECNQPWPRELLAKLDARILTYGYDAYVIGRDGPVTRNRLHDHARDFLNDLVGYRRRTKTLARTLIFIVHSLGGLLCKDMLLLSRNAADSHLRDAVESTTAIAFMGTPHSGSALAGWAQIPVKSFGMLRPSSTKLLSILQFDNDVLNRIHSDFLEMIRARAKTGREIQITCFYEALPMAFSIFVVPQESAILAGFNNISIHANHRNMVRFKDAEDPGFRSLHQELSRWIEDAKETQTAQAPRKEVAAIENLIEKSSTSPLPIVKSNIDHDGSNMPSITRITDFPRILSPSILPSLPQPPPIDAEGTTSLLRGLTAQMSNTSIGQDSEPSMPIFKGSPKQLLRAESKGPLIQTTDMDAASSRAELVLLHQPMETKVDLVFVHGIGGGARGTWSYSKPDVDCWPQRFLPFDQGFEHCRIQSFRYTAGLTKEDPYASTVADYAQALLALLVTSSTLKETPDTPIIFICHSTGGLIAKKAYLLAQEQSFGHFVAARCRAMIFLSTPHRGSDFASTLNKMLTAGSKRAPKFLLIKDLERSSKLLDSINEDFRHVADRLKLVSFYETRKTSLGSVSSILIVEKQSAVLGYPGETIIPLDADHRNMCKFPSNQDPAYITVRDILAGVVANASEAIVPRGDYGLQLLQEVEELPQIVDQIENQSISESGGWITKHENFRQWCLPGKDSNVRDAQILLFQAKSGAGKSFIARHIVQHLVLNGYQYGYFIFSITHENRSRPCACLKLLAFQLIQAYGQIRFRLNGLHEASLNFDPNNVVDIWNKLFSNVIFKAQIERPFNFVIDAIHECADAPLLLSLLLCPEVPSWLRIFMTCRTTPNSEIKIALEKSAFHINRLELPPDVIDLDVKALVSDSLAKLKWDEQELSDTITHEVLHRASGCFRWIKLIFEDLQGVHTESGIRQVLDGVPAEMAKSYTKAMEGMSRRCKERRLLASCLAAAVLHPGPGLMMVAELQKKVEADLKERVFGLRVFIEVECCDFLVVEGDGVVAFVHDTARKFLVEQKELDLHEP